MYCILIHRYYPCLVKGQLRPGNRDIFTFRASEQGEQSVEILESFFNLFWQKMPSRSFSGVSGSRRAPDRGPHPGRAQVQPVHLSTPGSVRHDCDVHPIHRAHVDLRVVLSDAKRFYIESFFANSPNLGPFFLFSSGSF